MMAGYQPEISLLDVTPAKTGLSSLMSVTVTNTSALDDFAGVPVTKEGIH